MWVCVSVYGCVCVCVCTQRFISENFLLRGNGSPPEVQPPASQHSFRHWPMPWQFWPLGFLDMSLHMEGKMVRPGKTPVAVVAFKGLCTCVFPVVPCELVASCKTPLASFPRALVRLLTCVSPLVGL